MGTLRPKDTQVMLPPVQGGVAEGSLDDRFVKRRPLELDPDERRSDRRCFLLHRHHQRTVGWIGGVGAESELGEVPGERQRC